jgi:hypothetical protein
MKTIKIEDILAERLDKNKNALSIDTRQNLANVVLRQGLNFLEKFGYEELLKIPAPSVTYENKRLDSAR